MSLTPRDRIIGGLVGLVVGDALGVPVEFTGRSTRDRDPVTGMRGFGTHHQPPGTWSDDGALALASAEAYVLHGADPRAQLTAFLAWCDDAAWTSGGVVFDIGNATHQALDRFRRGVALDMIGGRTEGDNGNGSLMRILPASCWAFGRRTDDMVRELGESSALTHAHVRSRLCCAYHALVVEALLEGREVASGVSAALQRLRGAVPDAERTPLAALLDGSCLTRTRDQVRSDGYVVSTLEAACWCLHQHTGFADAVLAAVNLGGDTDTTGAVAGGLAGLRCGLAGIPSEWVATLPGHRRVVELAERFADACVARWADG